MIESLRIKSVSKIKNLTAIFKKKQEAATQAALQAKLEHENSVMTVSAAVSTADHRSNQPFAQGQGVKTGDNSFTGISIHNKSQHTKASNNSGVAQNTSHVNKAATRNTNTQNTT